MPTLNVVEINGTFVQTFRLYSRTTLYVAWERDANNHSTITYGLGSHDGCFGQIGTINIPAELDALPAMTDVRSNAVRAFRTADHDRAYAAILAAYPELAANPRARRSMGEIEVVAD